MQKEADQQILQHLWDNLASRSSNIETLTIRDMVPRFRMVCCRIRVKTRQKRQ